MPREKLEKQREDTGMGTGSLFIANALAESTGKSFEEIVAERRSGKGWGVVARDNDVKLGPIVSRARKAENAARKAARLEGEARGKDKSGKVKGRDKAHGKDKKVGKDVKANKQRGQGKVKPPKPRGPRKPR